ncbi:hypothetical protein LTR08_003056 [Meristemomyces frigidus]|nr:hypothetical protein LTR08_003056 [Meristemomyces frigidus]
MAMLGRAIEYPIRHANKEPEWSSICNNVFDQYLDTDDLFGLEADYPERSSSGESCNLFDFSTGSEQSHQTSGTSPIPPSEYNQTQGQRRLEAQQPQAKEPVDFWTKTLRALEQNAAESERQEHKLTSAKSHPDFLSLGGCPSPPAIPSSPTGQPFSARRVRSRGVAANGRKASQARSLSRGRPTGVTKSTAAGATAVNSQATARKCSASPAKMMTPSRYRAGFRDDWTERSSLKKYGELRVPSMPAALPVSPPASARLPQTTMHANDNFAAFGSPPPFVPLSAYDDQLSALTSTFQQAHIHTPMASPMSSNAFAHAANSYFDEDAPPVPAHGYAPQTILLNDTAPLFPDRTSSLAANKIQSFDFGFASSPDLDTWSAGAPFAEPVYGNYTTNQYGHDPFAGFDETVIPTIEPHHALDSTGLGISCDPSLVSNLCSMPDIVTGLPASAYHHPTHPSQQAPSPYYIPPHGGLPYMAQEPSTPHCPAESRRRSADSPTPPPMTDSRARHRATRRSASRHRRTKSTGNSSSAPRHPSQQSPEKGGSGFVNYTPHDCTKILSGVAPSGSSKTKARREKEAADKRRRLSEAAVRAVVDAGGDLDGLARAGLFS